MKLLLDMNLAPPLLPALQAAGYDVIHWSSVGNPRALDSEIMAWAAATDRVVLTHDLDFGAILAASGEPAPSVLQLRTQDLTPEQYLPFLQSALVQFKAHLEDGALITVDRRRAKARILPIQGRGSAA